MAQHEVDAVTGTETTGHEWDGIRELNTPLPKWWLYVFYATILFSVVYTILFPAWPWLSGYTGGILGYSSRAEAMEELAEQRQARAVWLDRFEQARVEEIAEDPELLRYAMAGGDVVFADNCAPCHGSGGAGRPGYPVLADDQWLWGGTLDAIEYTLIHGIRSGRPEERFSLMPAFGIDGILAREEIAAVAAHVLSLSGRGEGSEQGQQIFVEQCAACHGEDGTGIIELGAPDLTDDIWLYGGTEEEIVAQITNPRHGVMPAWSGRLGDAEIKQVTIYVHSLGGGQ